MITRPSETELGGSRRAFESTLWTEVLSARDPASPVRRESLERLIHAYWKPVYFFVRRRGTPVEESKDLTQAFFTHLLDGDSLRNVSKEKGKFRTFLLTCLEHFLSNATRWERARRRSNGRPLLSLDFKDAEAHFAPGLVSSETPHDYFERQWALAVLGRALEALAAEMDPATFARLKPHLVGSARYAETAAVLDMPVSRLNNLVHRTRGRFRQLVEAEVRASVRDLGDVQEELADLLNALKN